MEKMEGVRDIYITVFPTSLDSPVATTRYDTGGEWHAGGGRVVESHTIEKQGIPDAVRVRLS
jgi:hypothetical protein